MPFTTTVFRLELPYGNRANRTFKPEIEEHNMKWSIVAALAVIASPAWACDVNCQQQMQIDDLKRQLDNVRSQQQPSYHYRNDSEMDAAIIRYYGGELPEHAWKMLSPEGQKKWKPSPDAYPPVPSSPCEDSPTEFFKKLFCSSAGK